MTEDIQLIESTIKPETELERQIISDQRFITGALSGKPRRGHPEGQVIYHIGHVLANVDKLSNKNNREKLRLIAIIHDCCKYEVNRSLPRVGDNHHAVRARNFAEKYITDNEILEIIELHDNAYNAYQKKVKSGDFKGEKRAFELIERLGDSLELFLTFYACDNQTGDKDSLDREWFEKMIDDYKSIKFTINNI
jgi:hypothetical protein